ncbi:MAG: hypothetical protein SX243_06625 [Acidobacteriota bacterium]|nr:hypothetical protein [Acidobacteriota bacterium]
MLQSFRQKRTDGNPIYQQTGLDYGSRGIDRALFGAFGGIHPGTSGTVYLDEFVSQR